MYIESGIRGVAFPLHQRQRYHRNHACHDHQVQHPNRVKYAPSGAIDLRVNIDKRRQVENISSFELVLLGMNILGSNDTRGTHYAPANKIQYLSGAGSYMSPSKLNRPSEAPKPVRLRVWKVHIPPALSPVLLP